MAPGCRSGGQYTDGWRTGDAEGEEVEGGASGPGEGEML